MKYVKVIFWTIFSLGVAVMVITFIATERRNYGPRQTPHYLSLQRLGELARIKYHHSTLHSAFAKQALAEGEAAAAQLLGAIAYSEQAQCRMCRKAIENLGGGSTLPIKRELDITSTPENIRRAIAIKQEHHSTKGYELAALSVASGDRYTARIMVWCDANDVHQITLLQLRERMPESIHKEMSVCSKCGYIAEHAPSTPQCPQCREEAEGFVQF